MKTMQMMEIAEIITFKKHIEKMRLESIKIENINEDYKLKNTNYQSAKEECKNGTYG